MVQICQDKDNRPKMTVRESNMFKEDGVWMVETAEVKAVDAMSAGDSQSEPEVSGMGS